MSETIDLGSAVLEGGYFLMVPNKPSAFRCAASATERAYQFCFTYRESPPSLRAALLQMIRQAEEKVFITSFRIGDEELFEAMIDAANRLRGGVYVVTALDEQSLARGLADSEEDVDVDGDALKKQYEKLTRNGIYVRGHPSCHAKFAVADDRLALVSTANFELRAFTLTGECGVVVCELAEVLRLARFFTRLWHEGCRWEIPPGQGYTVQSRQPAPSPCSVPLPEAKAPGVLWTCEKEHFILTSIRDLIESAQKEILLSSFSLQGMVNNPDWLLDPISKAIKQRGVKVRCLVRCRNSPRAQRLDAAALQQAGVELVGDSLNHAKMVIADGSRGTLFSANFDALHGLTNGVEVGARLDGHPALKDLRAFFLHTFKHADARFVSNPTAAQLDGALSSGWRKPWPVSSKLSITADPSSWERLKQAGASSIVLFERTTPDDFILHCGKGRWKLLAESDGDTEARLIYDSESTDSAGQRLERWIQSSRRETAVRGICPAQFLLRSGAPSKRADRTA